MRHFQAAQFARFTKFAFVWAFSTIILSSAWFYSWFNYSWFGATGIIVRWQNADGEGAYNAMDTEMLLISALICLTAQVYLYRTFTPKKKRVQHSQH